MAFSNLIKRIKNRTPKNKYRKSRKKIGRVVFFIAGYAFLFFLLLALSVLVLFIYYSRDLPRPENFTEKPFIQSTKIYDRTGKILLYNIYGEEKREIVPLDQISDNFKKAVLASEDSRFYQHHGVDLRGIARAVLVDLKLKSPSQGASTITQQLIRSSFLTRKKTIERKIQEIILALELERRYPKDQILEWYLNQIPFGENSYGIEAASQTYFTKSASALSLSEAAILAAVIPAPSYYSPYGPNREKLFARKDYILNKMEKLDYITEDQLKISLKEKITFIGTSKTIKAPHFVFYVMNYLEREYGEDYLREKGLKVYTSLDWDIQKHTEDVITEKTKINEGFSANNTAAAVLNPKTGEILALVGSKNYFGKAYPEGCNSKQGKCLFDPYFDVATLGERQPGSSFKPFVYATAFKKGYTPSTLLWDVPTEFNPNCNPNGTQEKDKYGVDCYHPHDYDESSRGRVTLRQSLAQSLNLPSVKLLYLAGIDDSLKTAQDLGMTTLTDRSRYGLSLVLGGGEVNLLEITSAYGAFATEGLIIPPVSILKIEDADGNIIKENKKEPKRVLSVQIARLINDVLSDNDARVPVFVRNNPLYFENYQVAAKTGTTSNYMDVWTIGYTPFAVVGIWAGNNDNSPINKKSGIGLAAPIWRKIMENLLITHPAENFVKPDPITPDKPVLRGEIIPGENHEILYYINKNDPLGEPQLNPDNDPQYIMWETGVVNWLSKNPTP